MAFTRRSGPLARPKRGNQSGSASEIISEDKEPKLTLLFLYLLFGWPVAVVPPAALVARLVRMISMSCSAVDCGLSEYGCNIIDKYIFNRNKIKKVADRRKFSPYRSILRHVLPRSFGRTVVIGGVQTRGAVKLSTFNLW
jgi:hypothetical protein